MTDDAGLEGLVPFTFRCQRSGRCCSGGGGQVWVEPDEVEALAAASGRSPEEFARTYLREVADPASGGTRLSVRERPGTLGGESGACALLEGRNECSVYEARPRHCRDFPLWPSVLRTREGFEAARATCPGITPLPDPAARERAFQELEALLAELDAEVAALSPRCELSGRCCRFEEVDHLLYATGLEADLAAARHPEAPAPEAEGRCPYHVRGLCTAREGRPIGCRTYFCDERTTDALQDLHERYLARVRAIEREHGHAPTYAPFPALLAARGIGEPREEGR
jgi:Fe-S-cluster containining protein